MVPATPVVFYESHMLSFLSESKDKAYSYSELGHFLNMNRKQAKNIARRLKRLRRVLVKPMKGQRKVRCGFKHDKSGSKYPNVVEKEVSIAYVMIDKKWLESQLPPSPASQKVEA